MLGLVLSGLSSLVRIGSHLNRGQSPKSCKKKMNGPSQSNFELADFFRSHSKASKLSKEEFSYVDGLIFSHTSPTKKILSLFPRATPLQMGKETPFLNSRTNSFSSTVLRTSRKRLEIFDKEFELSKQPFVLNEEPVTILGKQQRYTDEMMEVSTENPDKNPKLETINVFNSTNYRSPPRQMTDAAKELMASINMNVDLGSENEEDISKPIHQPQITNLPKFEFDIPGKKLPEFHFDISESIPEKTTSVKPEQTKYKFDFIISDFAKSKPLEPTLETKLPNFYFKID